MISSTRFAFTLILFSCISFVSLAQFQGEVYQPDTTFKLFSGNNEKTIGFAGGFNTPQISMGDLNNDGKNDLVVFEKGSAQVKTFINFGAPGAPDYRYRPHYAKNFPQINSYLKLEDYNCDDIPDLIHRGMAGFSVYKGFYSNNELKFSFYKELFYSPLTLNNEDFEFSVFPPSAWKMSNTGWSRETSGTNPSVSPQSGNAMARFNSNTLPAGSTARLISKRFRISNQLGNNARVRFWIYRDNGAGSAADSVSVYISHDTTLNNALYLNRVARSRTISQPDTKPANGWYEYDFPIPSTVTGDTLYLIFKATSQGGNNIFIDNINWITSQIYGDVNAYVDPGGDIPGMADVDSDGDFDFFAFNISGAYINFYKNYRSEENLHCDSIRVNLKDGCWGKVYQGFEVTQTLGINCPFMQPNPPPAKTTHTGNTLCFFDHDGDGDYDYLNGNISFPTIQLLENGKAQYNYPIDTIVAQDTSWQSNGHVLNMQQWPGAYWQDIDQDGLKDILISPNADNVSENYNCLAWYKNTGSATSPVYTYQNDSLLISEMMDMGAGSYPMIYDYNRDGKPDLFVGAEGRFQAGGPLRGRMTYYENTSTPGNPAFTQMDNDFLGINALNVRGAFPAVGDLNNDGKDDLVVGHNNGTISLYLNTAVSGTVQPQWQLDQAVLKDNNNNNIDSVQTAAPFIYDIDKDGKKDLIIGGQAGWLMYYRNIGNNNELKLQHQTSKLGMAKADPQNLFFGYSVPFIGKMDNSNHEYLLMGSSSGYLYRYTGFQNGNVTVPYQLIDTVYSNINSKLTPWSGFKAAPAIADLDGDSKYEMVLGNVLGGVTIYKQSILVDVADLTTAARRLKVYPNPARDMVYVSWEGIESVPGSSGEVTIYSVTGQKLINMVVNLGAGSVGISTDQLAAGTYICTLSSGTARKSEKLLILK